MKRERIRRFKKLMRENKEKANILLEFEEGTPERRILKKAKKGACSNFALKRLEEYFEVEEGYLRI